MRVWGGVVGAGLGVLAAGCAGVAGPITGPSSAPTRAPAPSDPATPAPSAGWLRVVPEQGVPGSTVSLDAACLDRLGALSSPALDISPLQGNPDGHQPWHLFGTATVRSDVAAGRYRISATCGTSELSADFTVEPARPR